MDIRSHNREAWNREVRLGNKWTTPVGTQEIDEARKGSWRVVLTPTKPVPEDWFPPMPGLDLLCLASGGGQQGPIFSAAGANVTVFDNSPAQLSQDRWVAERETLALKTIEGDMAHLDVIPDQSFDLIFHPVSNIFVPDVNPVWKEAFRVLRPGGILLSGFVNPVLYLFDFNKMEDERVLEVRYSLPYSDLTSLSENDLKHRLEAGDTLEFGHLLSDQIGGQLAAGFVLTGFYEDQDPDTLLCKYIPTFIATRAVKPWFPFKLSERIDNKK